MLSEQWRWVPMRRFLEKRSCGVWVRWVQVARCTRWICSLKRRKRHWAKLVQLAWRRRATLRFVTPAHIRLFQVKIGRSGLRQRPCRSSLEEQRNVDAQNVRPHKFCCSRSDACGIDFDVRRQLTNWAYSH